MSRFWVILIAVALGAGAVVQEFCCHARGGAGPGRAVSALVSTAAERAKHGSASLMPTLTGVLQERRRDFQKVVFDPIQEVHTNALSAAAGSHEAGHLQTNMSLHAPLFKNHSRVEADGCVVMVVKPADASERSQHFVVRLASGNLVLISRDTERGTPITDLKLGDEIAFAGEYSYGVNGDEISCSHAVRPGARPGWIRHNGRLYH